MPVPSVGTAGRAGRVLLGSVKNRKEVYMACKDLVLEGTLLGLRSAPHEILAFPMFSWLGPPVRTPQTLTLFLPWSSLFCRKGKLRHVGSAGWAGSAAVPYLL